MGAQKGKALLLRIESAPGVFTTIAGLRARSLTLNAESADITNADSAGAWRELLAGAGVRSVALSGAGIFKDAASDELLRSAFFGETLPGFELVIPDFGTLTGPFQIRSLEYAGEHDGEVTFTVSLDSAGAISFAAAP